ncbi:cysteine hydrolase [Desulfopila sp. IMCC35006]|uniref:cysteine hydrolase family protein n=1 Tax=Desulfopila sp. IMCC35006 TaxID=2569542 RepID=UPI0010AD7A74|nr:cysteine hydrolase family protein [Desulfopila sp. IMCC35006]TKB23284.1 cysteine hydrolase [Desulfopila sp. IMCC35006]
MNRAVLVIDVQRGLCEGPDAAFDCAGIITKINLVTRHARQVGAPVIFVQHESASGFLLYGSEAWQLADGLEVEPADLFIRKTTPDSFLRTGLELLLKKHQVEGLLICGMHTEFCVDTTTRRALALGFPVILVSDAHTTSANSTLSPQQVIAHHNLTLASISSFGPRVVAVPSHEVNLFV